MVTRCFVWLLRKTKFIKIAAKTTAATPTGPIRPRNGTACHEKRGTTRAKNGTKESSVALTTRTTNLRVKDSPAGEEHQLLKAELAIVPITGSTRETHTHTHTESEAVI